MKNTATREHRITFGKWNTLRRICRRCDALSHQTDDVCQRCGSGSITRIVTRDVKIYERRPWFLPDKLFSTRIQFSNRQSSPALCDLAYRLNLDVERHIRAYTDMYINLNMFK
ncbi:hypothetical protein EniLVp02_0230 [Vibrio phage EniLVp02]